METTPKNTAAEAGTELWELASRSCNDALRPEDLARLESLLAEDRQARQFYGFYMLMHAELAWRFRTGGQTEIEGRGTGDEGRGMAGLPVIDLPVGSTVELPHQLDLESQIPKPRTPNPEPPFPTLSTTHYPLPTTQFVGSWAFSYMVATVIMGVAILGTWAYKITHHQHIAEAPSQSAPSRDRPEMVFVGRITGMVDVKWSDDPRYLPPLGFAHVPLGRKYILSSGLMEITYDSGAKVILEGPCTYEVESTAGGYLALGKLTARIGERGEGRGESAKPQAANQKSPSSFILHPSSLFSVRTPTAIVTDLGTEFGVEVSEEGHTTSHVFRGSVEVQTVADGQAREEVVLGEKETARVERGEGGSDLRLTRNAAAGDPPKFVRLIPKPPKAFRPKELGPAHYIDGSVFQDDFDGDEVDGGKWTVSTLGNGSVSVSGGLATISSRLPQSLNKASIIGAAPLDFSGSPDDWWVEARFMIAESMTSNNGGDLTWGDRRQWIVLGGSTNPANEWEMLGFDLRALQLGGADNAEYRLGWWGWDNKASSRWAYVLHSHLDKDRFYNVKIHRTPFGGVDIYLDGRLIAVKSLIGGRNPSVLICGDYSRSHVSGTQIFDYVKVGALIRKESTANEEKRKEIKP